MPANGNTALHIAVINNRLDRLNDLLKTSEYDYDEPNHRRETALFLSLKSSISEEFATALIDHGCNVNIPNRKRVTPLHLAAGHGSKILIRKLLENGADTNAKSKKHNCTPLHRAVAQGRLANVKELLRWPGTNIDELKNGDEQTPLLYGLCKNSNDSIISILIDYSEDVNMSDVKGRTALHYAISRKSMQIAHKLIQKGANVNVKDKTGSTPLHYCVLNDNLEGVHMLLYYNASVNEENDCCKKTPIRLVLKSINVDLVRYLLDYVIDLNQKDSNGFTLLHTALEHDLEIALDLIEKGADVNVLSNDNHILYVALTSHSSYDLLKSIWSKTDFQLFGTYHQYEQRIFLSSFGCCSKLRSEDFLSCLYMILDSPDTEYFLSKSHWSDEEQIEESVLESIISGHYFSFQQRLQLIYVLLSYGVDIHFNDIIYLYDRFGFDQCLEVILMNGCYIHPNRSCWFNRYPIINRIRYDRMEFCEEEPKVWYLESYLEFYRATFEIEDGCFLIKHRVSSSKELSSLLEICRDNIRKIIYKKWSRPHSFGVYQALSELPLPLLVKDILFLKKPIYVS